jgi:hypothetical protein
MIFTKYNITTLQQQTNKKTNILVFFSKSHTSTNEINIDQYYNFIITILNNKIKSLIELATRLSTTPHHLTLQPRRPTVSAVRHGGALLEPSEIE